MEIVGIIFLVLLVVGVVLAIYEKRKRIRWIDEQDRGRAQTNTDIERIRAEDSFTHHNW
jgi:uncharacterized membrane protein